MPSLADITVSENLVTLACGKGGSGKSTALATLPKPMYIFDIDQRIKGILGSGILSKSELAEVHFDFYDTKYGFKKIDEKFYEMSLDYDKRKLRFKTIIIESADQLFEMLLIDAFRIKVGGKEPQDSGKTKGTHVIGNVAIATPDDYKYVYGAFRKLFYNYFKYFHKCNMILSAGTTPVWGKPDGDSNQYAADVIKGRRIYAPQGLADLLPRMFDEIWEFDKNETGSKNDPLKYTVHFRSDIAKTCIRELPNEMDITNKSFFNELKRYLPKEVTPEFSNEIQNQKETNEKPNSVVEITKLV